MMLGSQLAIDSLVYGWFLQLPISSITCPNGSWIRFGPHVISIYGDAVEDVVPNFGRGPYMPPPGPRAGRRRTVRADSGAMAHDLPAHDPRWSWRLGT